MGTPVCRLSSGFCSDVKAFFASILAPRVRIKQSLIWRSYVNSKWKYMYVQISNGFLKLKIVRDIL
jgi:hypothetical protein